MFVFLCGYVYLSADGCLGGQRHQITLELASQVVLSCLTWMVATEPGSFARAA